jgi:hypothetical protein
MTLLGNCDNMLPLWATPHFEVTTTPFNVDYIPAQHSRQTTNFVNLARDDTTRQQNLKILFEEIESRYKNFNGPDANCKDFLHLEIVTVLIHFEGSKSTPFPMAEFLQATFENKVTGERRPGPTGFNFSSYIRDWDFNILLPQLIESGLEKSMNAFGKLHGLLYQMMFKDFWFKGIIETPCIFVLSVSTNKTYQAQKVTHPILGRQFQVSGPPSLTDKYFSNMGLEVSYFQPPTALAPLAFYHRYNDLQKRHGSDLAALIAVMETFQRIYRPEIYASNIPAGEIFTPSLNNSNFVQPRIRYDRLERDQKLARHQANIAWNDFLQPHAKQIAKLLECFTSKLPPEGFNI